MPGNACIHNRYVCEISRLHTQNGSSVQVVAQDLCVQPTSFHVIHRLETFSGYLWFLRAAAVQCMHARFSQPW